VTARSQVSADLARGQLYLPYDGIWNLAKAIVRKIMRNGKMDCIPEVDRASPARPGNGNTAWSRRPDDIS
jgi:hypothetical protein